MIQKILNFIGQNTLEVISVAVIIWIAFEIIKAKKKSLKTKETDITEGKETINKLEEEKT